jgi:hypothetical protein
MPSWNVSFSRLAVKDYREVANTTLLDRHKRLLDSLTQLMRQ